jgi:hypothetical protein
MDEECFHGIAHAWALHFRVKGDLRSHRQICLTVDVGVTEPLVVLDHRNARVFDDRTNKLFPTPGDH